MTNFQLTAGGEQALQTEARVRAARVVCVLLFFSAFPPLIYQIIWQRALSDLLGNETVAAAMLLAALMLGLALGSLAGGLLSKRRGLPLLPLVAAAALASGAIGLAVLPMFAVIGVFAGGSGLPGLTIAAALALAFVSALPTGASLPLLADPLSIRSHRLGWAVGRIACTNNFGAGAACLAGLGLLFWPPTLDIPDGVCVAATINAAVACAAVPLHWRFHLNLGSAWSEDRGPGLASGAPRAVSARRGPVLDFAPALLLAAAVGFVALGYEVFFFHATVYAAGPSTTAFAATLSAFLLGLASGARRAAQDCAALTRDGAMRRAMAALIRANIIGIFFLPVIAHLAWLDRGVIVAVVLIVFFTARFCGAMLPYLAELGIAVDNGAAMRVGWLACANYLGAALGATLTGVALLGKLGLVATAILLVGAGLVCAALLVWTLAVPRWEKVLRSSLAGAVGLFAAAAIPLGSINVPERLRAIGSADRLSLVHELKPE